ncbi:MAG TPA: hypothetical protein VE007_13580 [Thermoanaerobaculia bacterium]|nr:hypothetical protein [Thermoanaerobaculia bacterium]
MRIEIEQTKRVLEMPLEKGPRLLLIAGVLLAAASFVAPLWSVAVSRPGASDGTATTYTFRLGAVAPSAASVTENASALDASRGRSEGIWIAVALGAVSLLFVRAAVLGTFRSLVDSFVLYFFFALGTLWLLFAELSRFGRELTSLGAAQPDFPSVLFGRWETGGLRFAASPGPGAWTLAAVALVLASALYVAWRNARRELTTEYLIAG